MKQLQLLAAFLLVSLLTFAQTGTIDEFLNSQAEIKEIEIISGNAFFSNTYKIMVEQPVDHSDLSKGHFLQRVFVADKGIENPVLLITEGYGADYASRPGYLNELSPMFSSNQICIEHRYFGESWPEPVNWEYLTVTNAAADHHNIAKLFKKFYDGKWINTGISKGGQTAVYHRTYYPNDVDVSVAYVCPLNFGVEDGRHEPFLRNVPGTAEQRKKIEEYQLEILKNRELIIPKLKEYSAQKNYSFKISIDEVLDYCVLEYPFALWQWGRLTDEIPSNNNNVDELFNHLMQVSGPSYFALEGMEEIKSFFVQAAHELGYYGYDTKPFKKYLSIKSAKNYISKIFLPEDLKIKYKKGATKEVKKFIKTTDSEILLIYGGFDPWSATAFEVPVKDNFLKIVKPGGSHTTRIKNLPEHQKNKIKDTLEDWLDIPVQMD